MRRERQESFPDEAGKGSLISNQEVEMRLLLWFAGPSFFLSSGDRIAGKVPELQQKCEVPFRSSRGNVRFARICLSIKGPHLSCTASIRFGSGAASPELRLWAGAQRCRARPKPPVHFSDGRRALPNPRFSGTLARRLRSQPPGVGGYRPHPQPQGAWCS